VANSFTIIANTPSCFESYEVGEETNSFTIANTPIPSQYNTPSCFESYEEHKYFDLIIITLQNTEFKI